MVGLLSLPRVTDRATLHSFRSRATPARTERNDIRWQFRFRFAPVTQQLDRQFELIEPRQVADGVRHIRPCPHDVLDMRQYLPCLTGREHCRGRHTGWPLTTHLEVPSGPTRRRAAHQRDSGRTDSRGCAATMCPFTCVKPLATACSCASRSDANAAFALIWIAQPGHPEKRFTRSRAAARGCRGGSVSLHPPLAARARHHSSSPGASRRRLDRRSIRCQWRAWTDGARSRWIERHSERRADRNLATRSGDGQSGATSVRFVPLNLQCRPLVPTAVRPGPWVVLRCRACPCARYPQRIPRDHCGRKWSAHFPRRIRRLSSAPRSLPNASWDRCCCCPGPMKSSGNRSGWLIELARLRSREHGFADEHVVFDGAGHVFFGVPHCRPAEQ